MKIYILRHEDRTQDCTFFSPLTKKGLTNSVELIKHLNNCKINLIFCSPFIRTLQTIYPYSKSSETKINFEYGLSEIHHPDIIPIKSVGVSLPEYLCESFNYEPSYKSIISSTEIEYPEIEKNVKKRIKKVLRDIISKYYESDNNILIVTHQSLCFNVLKIVNNSSKEYKNKLSLDIINNYEKGKLCLVYDNDWTYKPIN